jgi:hypothetical protein
MCWGAGLAALLRADLTACIRAGLVCCCRLLLESSRVLAPVSRARVLLQHPNAASIHACVACLLVQGWCGGVLVQAAIAALCTWLCWVGFSCRQAGTSQFCWLLPVVGVMWVIGLVQAAAATLWHTAVLCGLLFLRQCLRVDVACCSLNSICR